MLKVAILFLFTTVFLYACCENVGSHSETEEEKLTILDCKKVIAKITKKVYKIFSTCAKEVKANSTMKEYQKKISCIIKCTLDGVGLLTDEGLVTPDSVQTFMNDYIPEDAHGFAHWATEHCVTDYGSKLDKTEEHCESYGEFTKCMQQLVQDFAAFIKASNCTIDASMG